MIRGLTFELIRDFSTAKKNIKYILLIIVTGGILIAYNTQYIKLEEKITKLRNQKLYLQAQNTKLKTEVAKLSSPQRIAKIAKRKLKMEKVNLENVIFLNSK